MVDGGTLNTSGTNTYKITSGSENNGIEIASGTVKMRDTTNFDISGTKNNNGILLTTGDLDTEGVNMTLTGTEHIGFNNQGGTSAKIKGGTLKIASGTTKSNLIYANADTETKEITFQVGTTANGNNNGVYVNGSAKLTDKGSNYTVNGSENNGIYSKTSGDIKVTDPTFTIGGDKNNGIYGTSTGNANITVERAALGASNDFTVTGTNNNGIITNGTGNLKVNRIRFDVSGIANNGDPGAQNNAIYIKGAAPTEIVGSAFTISGRDNNAVLAKGAAALDIKGETSFDISGNENNGVYIDGTASTTAYTDYNSSFTVTGTNSNAVYAKKGAVELKGTSMDIQGSNNNGLIVFKQSDVTPVKIGNNGSRRASFTVSGDGNNNGIYATNGSTIDSIDGANFTVSGNGIGLLGRGFYW